MKQQERTWLTTGQAAELCAVTSATVLNWIRKGRLEAVRTAGGHYRIRQTVLEPHLTDRITPTWESPMERSRGAQSLRCWDYLSDKNDLRDQCMDCLVYRVRASWCFRIAAMEQESSDESSFVCPSTCDDCSYFRRVMGLPTHVLVVSSDQSLLRNLTPHDPDKMMLRFAHNAYEASSAVEVFSPSFVVLDQDHPSTIGGGLLQSLAKDTRLPGLKIVLAVPNGASESLEVGEDWNPVSHVLEKPFGPDRIEAVINTYPVEMAPPGEPISEYPSTGEGKPMTTTVQARLEPAADVNDDGFLRAMSNWDKSAAEALAVEYDIGTLTDEHWSVIEYVQGYYKAYGKGPPVIKVHKVTGLTSEDICRLFPCGMVKGAYRLAGLPRPPGCG